MKQSDVSGLLGIRKGRRLVSTRKPRAGRGLLGELCGLWPDGRYLFTGVWFRASYSALWVSAGKWHCYGDHSPSGNAPELESPLCAECYQSFG